MTRSLNHRQSPEVPRRSRLTVSAIAAIGVAILGASLSQGAAEAPARPVPAPTLDEARSRPPLETAVLAGGCFWGVQGVFQHVDGVANAVSGYAGGERSTAHYQMVGSGRTGHAEAVRISYDPRRITFGRILQIYFSVAHDPTELDRQGPDVGPQYRSAIFPANADQAKIARAYIAQLEQAKVFKSAIVTKIEPDREFFPAEAYHQDFLTRNPGHPYIVINDRPKIESLRKLYPERYRVEPALVANARATQ